LNAVFNRFFAGFEMRNQIDVIRTVGMVLLIFVLGGLQIAYAEIENSEPTLKQVIEQPDEEEVAGEEVQETTVPSKPLGPVDKFNRGVPRTAVAGFFSRVKAQDFVTAAEYLDLRSLPSGYSKNDGPELAHHLKVILDRTLWVDMDTLSTEPNGHKDDGLPPHQDFMGRIPLQGEQIDVLLQQVPRGDGVYIWKFSSSTVRDIPRLYKEHGYGKWGEKLYLSLPDYRFLTLQTWQWAALLALFIFVYTTIFIPTALLGWLLRRKGTHHSRLWSRFITGPVRWLIVLAIVYHWIDIIHPSVETRAFLRAGTLITIIFTWALIAAVGIFKDYFANKFRRNGREHAIVLLRPAATAVKTLIIITASLIWLDNIGYKVSTLIAGLGIGGIAVALAAQKSIENLIGAAVLYMATPVRVGDFCRFGDNVGTVEEIGLRSTRIRTQDRTVITIPNADFAAMPLENFSEREKIRFNPKLYLRYGTKPEQIKQIITEFEKFLNEHEKVDKEPNATRFMGFGTYALELNVFAFILTTNYQAYLEIAEELNMRILEIIDAAGVELANPAKELFKEKT
jgi:MscS family membrane protein